MDKTPTLAASVEGYWNSFENPGSLRGYRYEWQRYRDWLEHCNIDVLEAKPRDVKAFTVYLRDVKQSRSVCSRALSVVRTVYGVLVVDGLLEVNPAREVKSIKVDSTPKATYLETEEALVHFLTTAIHGDEWHKRRARLCLYMLAFLGWRRFEVAASRIEDFSGDTATHVVKGGKIATVGLPAVLQTEIASWRAFAGLGTKGALVPRSPKDSRSVSGKIVYEIVKAVARRAGQDISPHGLRRTFVTLGRKIGADLHQLQRAVSHSSITTTERYDKGSATGAPGQQLAETIFKK